MNFMEKFGNGHLDLDEIELLGTSDRVRALHFGNRIGCPNVPALIEERGADVMASRYGEILSYYEKIIPIIRSKRKDIANQIEGPIDRLPNEPLNVYNSEWIPISNLWSIPGPETSWGYSLPRLMITYIKNSKNDKESRRKKAFQYLKNTLNDLTETDDATSFLVKFAERLVTEGKADPLVILPRVISQTKLTQDNFYTYFKQIVESMETNAPTLFNTYQSLNDQQKLSLGIANPFIR
jgi:hypothetical protein